MAMKSKSSYLMLQLKACLRFYKQPTLMGNYSLKYRGNKLACYSV